MRQSIFIGKLTVAPDLRRTHEGTAVLNLELLVEERKGATKEHHRFPITVWGAAAERIAKQAKAGSEIVAFCKPEHRPYLNKAQRQCTSQDHVASWIRVCQPESAEEIAANE